MPIPLLNAYSTMLPRLQAEESLRRVEEQIATTLEVERPVRQRIISDWERIANLGREPERLTPDQMAVKLALIGIGVKKVSA